MTRIVRPTLAALAALSLVAAWGVAQETKDDKLPKLTKTNSGLQYARVKEGTGPMPKAGQTCKVHYTGWLYQDGKKGKKFDSSRDRGEPFEFAVGRGDVIKGWDEGVALMKEGGRTLLVVPPDLAYGPRGAGGVIPPNATLLFDVELLDIE